MLFQKALLQKAAAKLFCLVVDRIAVYFKRLIRPGTWLGTVADFDKGWHFHLGDVKKMVKKQALNDAGWRYA